MTIIRAGMNYEEAWELPMPRFFALASRLERAENRYLHSLASATAAGFNGGDAAQKFLNSHPADNLAEDTEDSTQLTPEKTRKNAQGISALKAMFGGKR